MTEQAQWHPSDTHLFTYHDCAILFVRSTNPEDALLAAKRVLTNDPRPVVFDVLINGTRVGSVTQPRMGADWSIFHPGHTLSAPDSLPFLSDIADYFRQFC